MARVAGCGHCVTGLNGAQSRRHVDNSLGWTSVVPMAAVAAATFGFPHLPVYRGQQVNHHVQNYAYFWKCLRAHHVPGPTVVSTIIVLCARNSPLPPGTDSRSWAGSLPDRDAFSRALIGATGGVKGLKASICRRHRSPSSISICSAESYLHAPPRRTETHDLLTPARLCQKPRSEEHYHLWREDERITLVPLTLASVSAGMPRYEPLWLGWGSSGDPFDEATLTSSITAFRR